MRWVLDRTPRDQPNQNPVDRPQGQRSERNSRAWLGLSIVGTRSFDAATPEDRSRERYRRAALTIATSAVARGIAIVTALISIPLTVHYLGTDRYGFWVTLTSFTALLVFADLGIGNGLLNMISEANGRDETRDAQKYVSSGFYMLLTVGAVVLLAFAATYSIVPWARVFNLSSSEAIKEAGPAVAVFVVCFSLSLPLGIVQRVQSGFQQGYLTNAWQAVGSVLSLGGLLIVVLYRGGLPWLVLAVVGASVFATLLNWVSEFGIGRRWLLPSYRQVEFRAVTKLAKVGFLFFILQATGAIAFASDNLVASQVLGPAAAARYSVAQRAFLLAPLVVGFIVAPLWPAYGEALARGDKLWVRKAFIRSMGLALSICVPLSACLVIFAGPIFTAWVGAALVPSVWVTLGLGLWTILYTLGSAVAMLLNAANVIGFQVIIAISLACTSIVLKILLAEHFGIAGIPWALVTTYTLAVAIPTSIYLVRRFRTDW